MKRYRLTIILAAVLAGICVAQVETGGLVRKRSARERERKEQSGGPVVTDRMQSFYEKSKTSDADLEWMREIYRQIDLTKPQNTPLYFPEDVVDGQENLFRLMLRLVVNGDIPAYEYLDGREVFTDQYKVNVPDMLDRFGVYYTKGPGSKIVIEEADVPTSQVLNYYILEKWEFDKRTNQMKTRVEAICPVLNRIGEYGGETKYPMFWIKYDVLRPWLAQQYVFLTDDNNIPRYSLDDYFNMGMYQGDIYKTKNLRNLSMVQLYPDPDDLKRAQDSIDNRLRTYASNLWVPTREEYLANKEKEARAKAEAEEKALTPDDRDDNVVESSDSEKKTTVRNKRSAKKRTAAKAPKVKAASSSSSTPNSSAAKSVRRRKR